MGITKAPISNKKADSLTPKKSNVNPVGVLKSKAVKGVVKNKPKQSSVPLNVMAQERKERQKATGMC